MAKNDVDKVDNSHGGNGKQQMVANDANQHHHGDKEVVQRVRDGDGDKMTSNGKGRMANDTISVTGTKTTYVYWPSKPPRKISKYIDSISLTSM